MHGTVTLRRLVGAGVVLFFMGSPVSAQLRPPHPIDWTLFEADHAVTARIGGGMFHDQRASLAGTEGRLLELGDFAVGVRSGRMAVFAGGTALRLFDDQRVFASPSGGAMAPSGDRRRDAGDFRISTLVMLTPPERDAAAVLRFGTRLPTTDNEVGLERDRTDFFALVGGRMRRGPLLLAGEAGVGINGTHDERIEQSDVLMYSASAVYTSGWFSPRLSLVGQMDGTSEWEIRGNEDLSEVRMGARVGRRTWLQADVVYGLQPFSPRMGVLLFVGVDQ